MKIWYGVFGFLFLLSAADGQSLITNIVQAHPDFRVVTGQLYNVRASRQWSQRLGVIRHVSNDVAVIQQLIPEVIITDPGIPDRTTSLGRSGAFTGHAPGGRLPTKKTMYSPGPFFSMTNLAKMDLVVGNQSSWLAMPVGTFDFDGNPIRLYDVGVPRVVSIVKTNAPRKK